MDVLAGRGAELAARRIETEARELDHLDVLTTQVHKRPAAVHAAACAFAGKERSPRARVPRGTRPWTAKRLAIERFSGLQLSRQAKKTWPCQNCL